MEIINITKLDIYLDIYSDQTITVSSSSNPSGVIRVDDNGNPVGSIIHFGSKFVTKSVNTISSDVILYDDVNFKYIETGTTELDNIFLIKPNRTLNYRIGASEETPTVNGSMLELDLTGKQVFAVNINGKVVDSDNYTYDSSGVTISSPANNAITGTQDYIRVYTYTTNQNISSGSLILTYQASNYKAVPTPTVVFDGSYFDDLTQICSFDSFSVNVSESNNKTNSSYQYVERQKEVNRESKWVSTMYEDLRETIKDKYFRIVTWDTVNDKMTIYNNCYSNDPINTSVNKSKNEYTYSFDFEDEQYLQYDDGYITYGSSGYGSGKYGSGTSKGNVNI